MKLLVITPEFPPDHGGGIITFYRDLVPALRAQGCEVRVLKGSAFCRGGEDYVVDGVAVSVLPEGLYHAWYERWRHYAVFPEVRRHLAAAYAMHELAQRLGEFDAIEVTDWGLLFLPWVEDPRVTVQMHGSCGQIAFREPVAGREVEGTHTLFLEQAGLAAARRISTYSRANTRWWEESLNRIVDYIPPPFSAPEVPAVARSGWKAFGRIQHWKGPQVACAAWAELGASAPVLAWHGRDVMRGATGASTAAGLAQAFPQVWGVSIQQQEQLRPAEVASAMAAAEVVVTPSVWDVFNLVTAEAMAAGAVVIVSDGAGAVDLIEPGRNGFRFAAGDAGELAEVVREVAGLSEKQRADIGEAAALTVAARLDPHVIAREKIRLYQRDLGPLLRSTEVLRHTLREVAGGATASFLDAQPLRGLLGYAARRVLSKVRAKRAR